MHCQEPPLASFKTMKAARAHSDKIVDDQLFEHQFFGNKVYLQKALPAGGNYDTIAFANEYTARKAGKTTYLNGLVA